MKDKRLANFFIAFIAATIGSFAYRFAIQRSDYNLGDRWLEHIIIGLIIAIVFVLFSLKKKTRNS
ncbi:hypothetical protein [Alkalicoccobacillus murimartini]|uniref:Membrane protein SirB2 n=1 Tax=Alkalicoccobacillus murimartini TaxID=171685 RepID=A0ABT9YDN0_9BACI|nr:hypothetical protein [Alkalicoccobacillus murimartini]MDQ0205824.1 putative membrane protein SirB2 [Alkalicoccobacillus murimartini]